jgi:hypothetical protein
LQDVYGDALAEFDQSEQEMLGADVVVVEPVGLLAGECKDLLRAGREVIHHGCLSYPHASPPLLRTSRELERCNWDARDIGAMNPFAQGAT